MLKIEFPAVRPQVRLRKNVEEIFCVIRKKWILLTPEEWVRQNFIMYLHHVKHYPFSLMSVEKKLKVGEMDKRYDLVVYDASRHEPLLAIECKEMKVALSKEVLQQLLNYNVNLQAPILIVTNGTHTYAFKKADQNFTGLEAIPDSGQTC